jgi:flavin reductase (NADH)
VTPDQSEFREAMAHLPAAVNILTTDGPNGRCGITLSAVCSVTDDPPTVLVCVNRASAMHDVFKANGRSASTSSAGSSRNSPCTSPAPPKVPMAERFTWDVWDRTQDVPVLKDALVTAVGTIKHTVPMGSHSVLFVEIEQIRTRSGGQSLVYFGRAFHRLDPTPLLPEGARS